jgi:hypothetical protein
MTDPEQQEDEIVELDEPIEEIEEQEDGSAIIRYEEEQAETLAHFANIVEEVDQSILCDIEMDLMDKIIKDKDARKKRDEIYEEGLRRTGLGDDAPGGAQFTGANKVVHPMLVKACVDFCARMTKELLPAGGPVRSKIVGPRSKEKVEQAERKTEFMNWQLTEQMTEFRGEVEQLATQLPLGGVQYLKLVWSERWKRPVTEFIPVDDVYLPFAATNFYSAERRTHVQYVTSMEYNNRVASGVYIDVDIMPPNEVEYSKASEANDKIEGRQQTSYNEDGLRIIFEVTTFLDFGDGLRPYIISIDKSTSRALSLYRNWDPEDDQYKELDWIVEFPFVPWRGAYPIGLTHMIGGLSAAATGALRALLDSAFIQNQPSLLKLKGGASGQTITAMPCEVVEMEGGAMVDDIRKLAMAIPFPGPSATLFQLLGFLQEGGESVIRMSFENLSDQNPNMPVGTTLALIEQGMVVYSSIHMRLHSAMAKFLKILHRINSAYLTEDLIKAQAGDLQVKPEDFDGPLDVIPVSDPQIFSETQRFAQVQALMQRAAVVPGMYDQRKIEEIFLRSLKISDTDVLQPKPGQDNLDPASENVAATMSRPIYVLPNQDHISHLQVHLAFLQNPLFGANPMMRKTYLPMIVGHLRDHILNYYLVESHKGVQLSKENKSIEDDASKEAEVINKVLGFINEQLDPTFVQLLPQLDQEAQQYMPPPPPPDPSMAIAQLGAQTQQAIAAQRTQVEQAKVQQLGQNKQIDAQIKQQQLQEEEQREKYIQAHEDQRKVAEIQSRERMNTADNQTAMTLAAAEIQTGEKFSVSTGTGVNPGA